MNKRVIAPIAALGIVFGDIGTSPLYSMNHLVFHTGSEVTSESAVGAASLVLWLLTLVICIKYVAIVLRADHHEQGGVFALLALLRGKRSRGLLILSALLIFGAGLLLGDGVITPAISVLSAIEGLNVAWHGFEKYTVLATVVILIVLFATQKNGTHKLARFFGPIMLIWFIFLAVSGLAAIIGEPGVFAAFNPAHAIEFLFRADLNSLLLTVGTVVLVVTGGEALFADMGHMGKRPIRQAWLVVVYPSLVLNYLGQAAYVLSGRPITDENIFFSMVPVAMVIPVVVLATIATVIASQALISAAFSLVQQGIALRYLPTMRVVHTNPTHENQTYVPFVNWLLLGGSLLLVITFKSSEHLGHAYGLAVAGDMVITTLAVAAVARLRWGWGVPARMAVFIPMLLIDTSLLIGNIPKIPSGGYVSLLIAFALVSIMWSWKWGKEGVRNAFQSYSTHTMREMLEMKKGCEANPFPRPVVLLTYPSPRSLDDQAPPLLDLFYKRYGTFPRHLLLLAVKQESVPSVEPAERFNIVEFELTDATAPGATSLLGITASYGFRESPDVNDVISKIVADERLPNDDLSTWLIHAGRSRIVRVNTRGLKERFRFGLYNALSRQSEPSYNYFGLDSDTRLTIEYVPVVL